MDVSSYGFGGETVEKVFKMFVSDNPSLFYISETCQYIFESEGRTVTDVIIAYTDGKVIDEFDKSGQLMKTADRAVIADKIEKLEETVNKILGGIPEDASLLEKEKYAV